MLGINEEESNVAANVSEAVTAIMGEEIPSCEIRGEVASEFLTGIRTGAELVPTDLQNADTSEQILDIYKRVPTEAEHGTLPPEVESLVVLKGLVEDKHGEFGSRYEAAHRFIAQYVELSRCGQLDGVKNWVEENTQPLASDHEAETRTFPQEDGPSTEMEDFDRREAEKKLMPPGPAM